METTKMTNAPSLKVEDLANRVKLNIEDIKSFTHKYQYEIKGNIDLIVQSPSKIGKLFGSISELEKGIMKMTKNSKKKLTKHMRRFECKPSLTSVNLLLHFLCSKVLLSEERVKAVKGSKELKIEESRRMWKETQLLADSLFKKYKEEKGNFYKVRM